MVDLPCSSGLPPDRRPLLPWGKLSPDGRWQPLADHCRDVAAVFVALLRLPGIRCRLARLGGVDLFLDLWIERLGWFIYLHDLGKVNLGFQARRDPLAPPVGHVKPIAGALDAIMTAIGAERTERWAELAALDDWFHAVLSHHGKPWIADTQSLQRPNREFEKYWKASDGYVPLDALRDLRQAADAMFPGAFAAGPPLPLTPRLIHALAGLATLADWIASSDWTNSPSTAHLEAWASRWLVDIGLDAGPWRAALGPAAGTFADTFGFAPTPAQEAFAQTPGALAILESETGSGKTEAALWRFVTRFRDGSVDGLYFALPTRTAAVQLHARVEQLLGKLWPEAPPPAILAVPGYMTDDAAGALPDARDDRDGSENDARGRSLWAAEHPKSYFAGMIGVGTIDQALLATLRVKHAHLRGASLMRHMLVIDEVHASDAYMQSLTETLLKAHLAAGGEAALLSATLGAAARVRYAAIGRFANLADAVLPPLDAAIAAPYPAITGSADGGLRAIPAGGRSKTVSLSLEPVIDDAAAIARAALAAAAEGAKVLVVRNSVAGAVAVQQALEAIAGPQSPLLFRVKGVATLHHGRFAREDRRLLDRAVECAVGRNRPAGGLVIVGTQTLEQSLDIDADYLITDLCPVDVLLQRLGRLHRHATEPDRSTPRRRPEAFREPRVVVLVPADPLARRLDGLQRGSSHGLGPIRSEDGRTVGTYPDLLVLEATRLLCLDRPVWTIPAMNRLLVESALHPDARTALLDRLPADERPDWDKHRSVMHGIRYGDGTTARLAALDRDKPFMDQVNAFPDDERLATRLGAVGLVLDLPEGTVGPFGKTIRKLAIPAWWKIDTVDNINFMHVDNGKFQLEWGALRLAYGRHGLHKQEA